MQIKPYNSSENNSSVLTIDNKQSKSNKINNVFITINNQQLTHKCNKKNILEYLKKKITSNLLENKNKQTFSIKSHGYPESIISNNKNIIIKENLTDNSICLVCIYNEIGKLIYNLTTSNSYSEITQNGDLFVYSGAENLSYKKIDFFNSKTNELVSIEQIVEKSGHKIYKRSIIIENSLAYIITLEGKLCKLDLENNECQVLTTFNISKKQHFDPSYGKNFIKTEKGYFLLLQGDNISVYATGFEKPYDIKLEYEIFSFSQDGSLLAVYLTAFTNKLHYFFYIIDIEKLEIINKIIQYSAGPFLLFNDYLYVHDNNNNLVSIYCRKSSDKNDLSIKTVVLYSFNADGRISSFQNDGNLMIFTRETFYEGGQIVLSTHSIIIDIKSNKCIGTFDLNKNSLGIIGIKGPEGIFTRILYPNFNSRESQTRSYVAYDLKL